MIRPLVGKMLAIQSTFGLISTPLFRNAYALNLSSASTSALGLLYWVLAARYYDPHTVGLNSALISAMLFLSAVAQLNLGGMMLRFVPQAGTSLARLIGFSYLASVIAALLVGTVFVLGLDFWSPTLQVLSQDTTLLLWFLAALVTWSIFTLQDSALTALRKTMLVPIENGLYAVAKIGLLIVFAVTFPTQGIFASWTIPVWFALIPINLLIFRRFIPDRMRMDVDKPAPSRAPQVVKFAIGNYIGAIFYQATTTLLPIMVADRLGVTANAYFYLPWTITVSLQMIALNMSASFTVEVAHDASKLASYCRRVLIHNLKILVPLVLILFVGAPYILGIFGPEYTAQGTDVLRLLALSVIPYSVISLYVGLARVQNRVGRIALVQGLRCMIVLTLSYLILPIYHLTGVGIVWLVSETLIGSVVFITQIRPFLQGKRQSDGAELITSPRRSDLKKAKHIDPV